MRREALGVLLGLKPFLGKRQLRTGYGPPMAEKDGPEFSGDDIASRIWAVYGFNHRCGQKKIP